jgi:hypothetical protein
MDQHEKENKSSGDAETRTSTNMHTDSALTTRPTVT